RVKVKVVKNKMAPPFQVAEFDILYAEGISKEGCLLDVGLSQEIVKKSGAFWSYGDVRLGQGRENAREFLRANSALRDQLEDQIRALVTAARVVRGVPAPATG